MKGKMIKSQLISFIRRLRNNYVDLTMPIKETQHNIKGHLETRFEQTKPKEDLYLATGLHASVHMIGTHIDKWWHRWGKEFIKNRKKFPGWRRETGLFYPDGIYDYDFPQKNYCFCYIIDCRLKHFKQNKNKYISKGIYWDGKIEKEKIKEILDFSIKKYPPPKDMPWGIVLATCKTWSPEISFDAVKYSVVLGAKVIATDVTLSFHAGGVHDLLQPGLIFVERLTNLEKIIKDKVVILMIEPLKLVKTEASPAIVKAIRLKNVI